MAYGINDFIEKLTTSGTTLTIGDIILALSITLVMAMFIYYIYKKTYSGVLYSKNFNTTLVVVSLIVCVIMMGISRNLALSLGLIGALSIVRFRNAIKDSKDVSFLFWSISVGIINGIQFYKLSITATIFIGIVLVFLSKKIVFNHPYLLILKHNGLKEASEKNIFKIISKFCSQNKIRNRTITNEEEELTIEIKIKNENHQSLIENLKKIKEIKKMMLISYTGDLHE